MSPNDHSDFPTEFPHGFPNGEEESPVHGRWREATWLQHGGAEHRVGKGLVSAIEQSVTFQTDAVEDAPVYARLSNTANHAEVSTLLARLHGAEAALVFGSGMAAMSTFLLSTLRPGDHVVAQESCYGATQALLSDILSKFGIAHTFAPVSEFARHINDSTRVLCVESISNPLCTPQDLNVVARLARERGLTSICDNTFASPVNCKPLALGIDVVLESGTKYLNGHSDVVCGVLAGSARAMKKVGHFGVYTGGFLSTHGVALLMRGLRTLALRMAAHNAHGLAFARAMAAETALVREVGYGGLSPQGDSLRAVFPNGFGGMVSVRFDPSVDVRKFMRATRLVKDVPSLGGTETIATMPYHTTHSWIAPQARVALGIDESLVRLSIGLEDVNDVVADVLDTARACRD